MPLQHAGVPSAKLAQSSKAECIAGAVQTVQTEPFCEELSPMWQESGRASAILGEFYRQGATWRDRDWDCGREPAGWHAQPGSFSLSVALPFSVSRAVCWVPCEPRPASSASGPVLGLLWALSSCSSLAPARSSELFCVAGLRSRPHGTVHGPRSFGSGRSGLGLFCPVFFHPRRIRGERPCCMRPGPPGASPSRGCERSCTITWKADTRKSLVLCAQLREQSAASLKTPLVSDSQGSSFCHLAEHRVQLNSPESHWLGSLCRPAKAEPPVRHALAPDPSQACVQP